MVESLFSALTIALGKSYSLALAAAFGWGILSVLLSPCHLSGIPLVIGYISSHGKVKVKRSISLSLLFAFGSLFTIAMTGVITASMGKMLGDTGTWGTTIISLLFVVMGLYLMDLVRLNWWNGISFGDTPRGGLWGAFLLGLLFGIGLGPCTFAFLAPVLGAVFSIASGNWLKAVMLVAAFGIGHAAVIAAAGSMTNLVQYYLNWTGKSCTMLYLKRLCGFFLLLAGLYFFYDTL
ncbi:MAG: cytochrome C biogenesis protein [Chlorobium sp.]|nr:MAG: cytochrome C biogenesis protein [Chlorobium sp.]